MTDVQIEAGTLTASVTDRVVSGLLLPFGEVGRTNLGRFSVDPGTITIPQDVSVLNANEDHKQTEPRARFLTATETTAGVVASFKVGENPEGDALLAAIENGRANGKPKALSVEVKNVVLRAGKAVSGVLTGAAFVDRGAFPSAALMAADVGEDIQTSEHNESEYTDANGVVWRRVSDTETTISEDKTTSTTTVVEETERPAEKLDEQEGDTVAEATVAPTLHAAKAVTKTEEPITAGDLFAMITEAQTTGDMTLLAALNDVKISGANQIGTTTVVPAYVGELWSGRRFARRVIPLLGSAPLTSTTTKGWRWDQKPEVAEWAGNKANVPSNTPTVTPYDLAFQRFAAGWDIAREFIDFKQTEVLDSFMRAAVDSYAKKTDVYVGAQLIAGATSAPVDDLPTGDDYVNAALVKLVDACLRVIAEDAIPSFALVAPDVYRALMLVKTNNALEFLALSLGLESGSMAGFKIVPYTGLAAGSVLAGAKEAATVRELGGSPIRVNAIDIARGGYDEALFGYVALQVDYPEGLQLVTDAVTP